jgi:ferrous iron transport protein B
MNSSKIKIALVGNPNIGKTTLFNKLCGLSQKTGNYPGVTIDKKKGKFKFNTSEFEVIDLPGINSLYAKSKDEELVINYLEDKDKSDFPDKIIVTVSALNLKRNLYLFHQIKDLEIPLILAINMTDIAEKRGIFIDEAKLQEIVGCPVVKISAKTGLGIDKLKSVLISDYCEKRIAQNYTTELSNDTLSTLKKVHQKHSNYHTFLSITHNDISVETVLKENNTTARKLKVNESILRYKFIKSYLDTVLTIDKSKANDFTTNADKVLLHPIFGYAIFGIILFTIFQSLFALAAFPMDWIDQLTTNFAELSKTWMPEGYLNDLISDGIVPGIGGILIFIPQIAILFLFFSILEESGYMSRIVFLMDKLMQKLGMSGKSVVPLMSSLACTIPGIMAARSIENKKERLITILIAPLLTCSARLPVYVVLISLVVPDEYYGPFNLQGLAMFGMYFIGIFASLIVALVFKLILKGNYGGTLLLEMPQYLWPSAKNTFITVWKNVSSFVINAGKIILATSVILFVLATKGGDDFDNAEQFVSEQYNNLDTGETNQKIASYQLENSYLGMIGKSIEPAIKPLGYDWKIGIALISSLAAREVFVGTMSTIYSINSEESLTIKNRLAQERNSETGELTFTLATSISLLLFYAFSLQCFSTIAVTYKETKSIKWTVIQFVYMSVFAYLAALIAYQLLA